MAMKFENTFCYSRLVLLLLVFFFFLVILLPLRVRRRLFVNLILLFVGYFIGWMVGSLSRFTSLPLVSK